MTLSMLDIMYMKREIKKLIMRKGIVFDELPTYYQAKTRENVL